MALLHARGELDLGERRPRTVVFEPGSSWARRPRASCPRHGSAGSTPRAVVTRRPVSRGRWGCPVVCGMLCFVCLFVLFFFFFSLIGLGTLAKGAECSSDAGFGRTMIIKERCPSSNMVSVPGARAACKPCRCDGQLPVRRPDIAHGDRASKLSAQCRPRPHVSQRMCRATDANYCSSGWASNPQSAKLAPGVLGAVIPGR